MMKMKRLITLLSFLFISTFLAFSQESSKISPSLSLQYLKDTDDSSSLRATLTYSADRMEHPLAGMKITFQNGSTRVLGDIITDEKGTASFKLKDKALQTDAAGMWPFSISFGGNDTLDAATAELSVKDVILKMETIDSSKTINLSAQKIEKGKTVPAAGEMLTVYVPRMFSLLPIGEVTLDDSGFGSLEFPADLPGDKDGNVTVIARFEEHPEFGNVEKNKLLKWGVPLTLSAHQSRRALWTKTAPKWMIYTLSVLLTGVWGHYLFAIISLVRIKIESKKKKEKELFLK
jgi:hypothetical protein